MMIIRNVTERDVKALQASLMKTIDTTNIYNETAKNFERSYYTEEYLLRLISEDKDSIFASFDGNVLTSFAISRRDNGPWWLSWFSVSSNYRGQGLGKLVVTAMLNTLAGRNIQKMWCDTRTNNIFSIRILENIGFVKLCKIENHWCNQDYFLWEWRTPGVFESTRQHD